MSAISLYTPSLASIIPPDGDLAGDSWADRAVAHPGLLWVPNLIEELPSLRPGIEGAYAAPPPAVVAAMYAKRWRIDAEVMGSGVTLALSGSIMEPVAASTWVAAIKSGTASSGFFSEGESPDNFVNLSISITSGDLWFSWADEKWWPGLSIFLQTRDFEAEGTGFGTAVIGGSGEIGGDATPVEVSFCGEMIPLYYTGTVYSPLSGTITITPEDYLDVD